MTKSQQKPQSTIIENATPDPTQWVIRYADYLYQYAISRTDHEEQAKDLVQDTFLAALRSREKFENRSSEKTWLTGILKNKIFDNYRSGKNRFSQPDVKEPMFFDADTGHWIDQHKPAELHISYDNALEQKELKLILKACMDKLPGLWFAAFSMKYIDDETADSICQQLKLTPSNYWVIMHRAKLNLRSCIQKNWV